jgi:hypothetical protein
MDNIIKEIGALLDEKLGQKFEPLIARLDSIEERLDDIDIRTEELQKNVSRIEEKVDMLFSDQPDDIRTMLQIMDKKLDALKHDVEFT